MRVEVSRKWDVATTVAACAPAEIAAVRSSRSAMFFFCIACFDGRVFRQMLYYSIIVYYYYQVLIVYTWYVAKVLKGWVSHFFLSCARLGKVTAGGMLCLHLAAVGTCAVKRYDSITGSSDSLPTLLTPTRTVPNVYARISRAALPSFSLVPGQS